jgi:hypothetical protein
MLAVFWQVAGETLEDFMNMSGAIFFLIVGQTMNYFFGSLLVF